MPPDSIDDVSESRGAARAADAADSRRSCSDDPRRDADAADSRRTLT
jgi:hypothetical protein